MSRYSGKCIILISVYLFTEIEAGKELGLMRETVVRWVGAGKFNINRIEIVVFIPSEEVESIKSNRRLKK